VREAPILGLSPARRQAILIRFGRIADAGEGEFVTVSQESQDACKAQCFTATEPGTAVEFNSTNGSCELHSQPITKFKKVEGVACYVARADG
jgi:hypothetical protein